MEGKITSSSINMKEFHGKLLGMWLEIVNHN